MAQDTSGPWEEIDPRRSPPDHPVVDDDSAAVMDDAVFCLTMLRSPMRHGDALARLHALVSLMAQAEALLPDAVADAWDQDYRWKEIGHHMSLHEDTVRRRYFHHAYTRVVPFQD
ncbi:MAG: hypothetical protein ACREKB_03995 [Candidatus Rokuibacteriota bacterium]